MRFRDPIVFKQYKSAQNAVCKDIKKELKKHQLHIAKQSKKNPKMFWKYINSRRKQCDFSLMETETKIVINVKIMNPLTQTET